TAASKRCSSLDLSLFADARPNASIRNWRSEYLRRSSSASAFDSAKLLVNAFTDSWATDNCLRNSSLSAGAGSPVADGVTVSILDSDKELFPCACTAEAAIKHHPIANCEMPIPNLKRPSPRLFNWQ